MKHKYFLMALCATLMTTLSWAQSETILKGVDFHDGTASGNYYSGTGYSTGAVTTGSYAHSQTASNSYWRRVPSNTTSALSALRSVYPRLAWVWGDDFETNIQSRLHPESTTCGNGFMMMSTYEQTDMSSGYFNAYIDLGTVDASAASVIDVRFFQLYKKYYDECYIDYRTSASDSWTSVEINTLSPNSLSNEYCSFTLPLEAAGNSYLDIRIRWQSRGQRGNSFGYWWLIDDVQIVSANPNRLSLGSQQYTQGGYGILPQGMNIKPAWFGTTINNGSITQRDVTASIMHLNGNQSVETTLGSYNNGSIAPTTTRNMYLDPEGWFGNDQANDYLGWFGYSNHNLQYGTCDPLPTQTLGDHYLYASLSTESGLTENFDTIYYSVNGLDDNIQSYRWGKDNGVLAYTPQNHYIFGYTSRNGAVYVSSDPSSVQFNYPGYEVALRYTTGGSVPAGWVIRGVELVASPIYSGAGSIIQPVLKKDEYTDDGTSLNFNDMLPNAENHTIAANEVNNESVVGLNSNGYLTLGNYNTIVMLFPEPPELEPYTSYHIGYKVVSGNNFAVATAADHYYAPNPNNPGTDTVMYFRDNTSTKQYASLFPLNDYDVTVMDTTVENRRSALWSVLNSSMNAPMIRMLVGPRQQGIGEVNSSKISICPNPASSQVTVQISEGSGRVQGRILDLNGREVISSEWDASQPNTINIASLSRGVYVLKVTANGKTTVEKLVVK